MSALTAADLRELADKLDGRQKEAAEKELQAKVDRMEAALARGGLSEEQQQVLDRAQSLLDELDAEAEADKKKTPPASSSSSSDDDTTDDTTDDKPKKTRPGRKSGAAYDWTVDDDGKVVKSDTAIVYTGADEADEVELDA